MLYLLFLLLFFTSNSHGARYFRLGREEYGNLGIPNENHDSTIGALPGAKWFDQKLDHFNPSDQRTWKQRYFVMDDFYNYNNPGPIFLLIGGEGPADARWMTRGSWIEFAKRFKAMCFNLEHRFYGESHPTPDVSVKNLQFLSSEQGLADLANFISAMNDNLKHLKLQKEVKWIVFGGSYPGSLAAWMRMTYPHLVYGAVSTSGPLQAKVDFMEYFEVVVNALREKTGSDDCANEIKYAMRQIEMMMPVHSDVIEKEFRVCTPFSNATQLDMQNFYNNLANNFAGVVQYNEDNRISEHNINVTINTACDMLTQTADSKMQPYKKMAAFNSIMLDESSEKCLDYNYEKMIQDLRKDDWESNKGGARQWMYQTCTEFGFYQTSSGTADIFGDHFKVDFFVQQCMDIFGKKYNLDFIKSAVAWTNSKYGALNIEESRVVYVHGSVDPWHALGITRTRENNAPAIYIKGTAHCADMYPASDKDPAELIEARVEIAEYISSWLDRP